MTEKNRKFELMGRGSIRKKHVRKSKKATEQAQPPNVPGITLEMIDIIQRAIDRGDFLPNQLPQPVMPQVQNPIIYPYPFTNPNTAPLQWPNPNWEDNRFRITYGTGTGDFNQNMNSLISVTHNNMNNNVQISALNESVGNIINLSYS